MKYPEYKDIYGEVADRIKQLRKSKREFKSQEKFGEKLDMSREKIQHRESHNVPYTIDELLEICNIFDVDIEYLLGIQEEVKTADNVKEPDHYKHGEFETIDEMIIVFGEYNTAIYCKIAAWKYRARANFKDNFEEDMAKADTYLRFAQELEQHTLLKG